jgi:hypothetical protein
MTARASRTAQVGPLGRNDGISDPIRPHPTPTYPAMTGPFLDPATLKELRRLARSRPRSGRQAAAKARRWRD